MNRKLSIWHFWTFFIFFNLTFFRSSWSPPRTAPGYSSTPEPPDAQRHSSVSAFLLGASFLIFIVNFVWSQWINPTKSPDNRGTRSASSGRHRRRCPGTTSSASRSSTRTVPLRGAGALPVADLGENPW